MKILFLSQRFIFPMDTGAKIRTGNILRELSKIADLTVISNVESPKDDAYFSRIPEICSKFIPVPWKETQRYTLKFWFKLLIQSLSRYPVSVLNDYSKALAQAVEKELATEKYDLAVCDFLQSTLIFQNVQDIPRLLFTHNVESRITERHLKRTKSPFAHLFWWLQHRRIFRHEKEMILDYEGTIAVSDEDERLMESWFGATRVHVIPTGVDVDFFSTSGAIKEKKQLVFTGSMDWLPNEDAMGWFIESVFPLIKEKEPKTELLIVGRRPTAKIERLIEGRDDISLTGWVEDTRPYISESAVYIVPIRIGGGTRMKIYEALSMGKALVSTTIGAEGLPLIHGEHMLREDSEQGFADSVVTLLSDLEERNRLGENAKKYVHKNFRWEEVAKVFLGICQIIIANPPINNRHQNRGE